MAYGWLLWVMMMMYGWLRDDDAWGRTVGCCG